MSNAPKHDLGKLKFSLVPVMPLKELVAVYNMGYDKYGPRSWEKGLEWSRIYDALMRHATAFWEGEDKDQESGLHHLAHAAWNCLALIEFATTHPELDDRPKTNIELIAKEDIRKGDLVYCDVWGYIHKCIAIADDND